MAPAGVKRLHPIIHQNRPRRQRSELGALLSEKVLIFDLNALPIFPCRRLRAPGLKIKPMYTWGKHHLHLPAVSQSGTFTFSVGQAIPHFLCPESPTPKVHSLKERPLNGASPKNCDLGARERRNSLRFAGSLGKAPVTPAPKKNFPCQIVFSMNLVSLLLHVNPSSR